MTENYKPHAYQKRAIRRVCSEPGLALFADPGTGKTSIVLASVFLMTQAKPNFKCLVIAPLAVADSTWPAEVQKWSEFKIRMQRLERGVAIDHDANLYVTTPDSFVARLEPFGATVFDLLVVDESTKFKNATSKRFKNLSAIRPFFRRCVVMTGTPAPNGPMDLWSQAWLVDTGRALGRNFYAFRREFFEAPREYGFGWKPMEGTAEKIQELIEPFVARVSADEVLDLPAKTENRIDIILPKAVLDEHKKLQRELAAFVGDVPVLAMSAGVAYGKCRQLAYGLTYDAETGDGRRRNATKRHDRKIQMLIEFADNLATPLLVFSEFTEFFELCRDAGVDAPILDGRTNPERRTELIDLWNLDEIKIMFCHPASVGHGLNLQGGNCRDIMWAAPPDNLELYDQGNARVHRQGVKNSVRIHVMVARGTVDEIAFERLHNKAKLQDAILAYFAEQEKDK